MRSRLGAVMLVALLLLTLLPAGAGIAWADSPADSARELRIERSLACPQCTDLALDVCENDICQDMRSIIHEKVAAGQSDQAIRQYFVDRYGARVLLAPSKSSLSLLVWLVPFLGLIVGALAFSAFIRSASHRRRGPVHAPAGMTLDRYRPRIEHELEGYE